MTETDCYVKIQHQYAATTMPPAVIAASYELVRRLAQWRLIGDDLSRLLADGSSPYDVVANNDGIEFRWLSSGRRAWLNVSADGGLAGTQSDHNTDIWTVGDDRMSRPLEATLTHIRTFLTSGGVA